MGRSVSPDSNQTETPKTTNAAENERKCRMPNLLSVYDFKWMPEGRESIPFILTGGERSSIGIFASKYIFYWLGTRLKTRQWGVENSHFYVQFYRTL